MATLRVFVLFIASVSLVSAGLMGVEAPAGAARRRCPLRRGQAPPAGRRETGQLLHQLREQMQRETTIGSLPLDAYIVTSNDEHQSETVADHDKRREFISGFTGSTGTAIITRKHAALWADGRYHIQADDQLSCDWLLMKQGQHKVPTEAEWLKMQFPDGGRVGADPKLIPNVAWESLKFELGNTSIKLVEVQNNLIDIIWNEKNRPPKSKEKAYVHDLKYAGELWSLKVERVRQDLRKTNADSMVVTALDEIAWMFNIRGKDIPHSPVVESYVIITQTELHLYITPQKVDGAMKLHLKSQFCTTPDCVRLHKYEDIWNDLKTKSQAWKLVLLPSQAVYKTGVSRAIYNCVPIEKILSKPSPIIFLQAKKNPVETQGMEKAHIRDAVAMCGFLAYFEYTFSHNDEWDELKVVDQINKFRYEQELSQGMSFSTIAGFGPHGASPHYEPSNLTNIPITENSTLVLDSGGHYLDGSTDVTRTLHMGDPTAEQKAAYTRVLIGSIQLSSLVFPANLLISEADVVARAPLWEVGLDYLHGTGHGIGSFLNVHESPISVSYSHPNKQKFKEGYFLSNEPGYYKEGDFGVRLENIMEVIVDDNNYKHYSGLPFLRFKDVTLVPYEPKLLDYSLLTASHRRWLNDYNSRIRSIVGAELKRQRQMEAFYWMMDKTKHIPEDGPVSKSNLLNVNYVTLLIILIKSIY